MSNDLSRIMWFDLETTGLDVGTLDVLEIGAVLTDENLNELGAPIERVMPYSDWSGVDEFVVNMHKGTGLYDLCVEVSEDLNPYDDEAVLRDLYRETDFELDSWLTSECPPGATVAMGGGGVSSFDRQVVRRLFPLLSQRLTYWSIDVSPVRRFLRLSGIDWPRPTAEEIGLTGDGAAPHRALYDARSALADARNTKARLSEAV